MLRRYLEAMPSESEKPFSMGGWRIQGDGWVSLPAVEGADGSLHVRVQVNDEGRCVITNVMLGSSRITSETLRQVQPSRLEATFNLALTSEEKAALLRSPGIDEHLTLGELRQRTPVLPPANDRIVLVRPDGTDPENFYRQVAEAYRVAAAQSRRPAAVIAEDSDVPVSAVHRWIREARRRGFLTAGEKGKAG